MRRIMSVLKSSISTTKKMDFECDECIETTQCNDCFVTQFETTGELPHGSQNKKMRVQFEV